MFSCSPSFRTLRAVRNDASSAAVAYDVIGMPRYRRAVTEQRACCPKAAMRGEWEPDPPMCSECSCAAFALYGRARNPVSVPDGRTLTIVSLSPRLDDADSSHAGAQLARTTCVQSSRLKLSPPALRHLVPSSLNWRGLRPFANRLARVG
jgi:hypothetical protein